MKEIEVQALVLDRLFEALKNGHKQHINLLEELTGEVSFKDLRAAVYTLSEMGYIHHNDTVPDNKGFLCRITKEGIKYHQDIFEPKESPSKGFFERIKDLLSFFEDAKTIGIAVFTIASLLFGLNAHKIMNEFPLLADLLKTMKQQEQQVPTTKYPLVQSENTIKIRKQNPLIRKPLQNTETKNPIKRIVEKR